MRHGPLTSGVLRTHLNTARSRETGRPSSVALATWALFAGLSLLLAGTGIYSTVVASRTELDGFDDLQIGLIGAGYYGGFIIGARVTGAALARVGHIRVYTALAALLTAVIVASGMFSGPWWWLILRFVAGTCIAGQYVGAESWLNALATNATRGRLLSIYLGVTVVAFGIGQVVSGSMDPRSVIPFEVAAILAALAVIPVALSVDAAPPPMTTRSRIRLRELWQTVPTGMVASVLVGTTHGAFIGLSAVYATRAGLSPATIGIFVAMPTIGNVLFSMPIATTSDRIDRRVVGCASALVAAGAAFALTMVSPASPAGLVCMVVIGGTTYPLYSIAGAYTSDKIPQDDMTAVASQLVLLYGLGAVAGPLLGSVAMGLSSDGFVWTIVLSHLLITAFLAIRIAQHPDRVSSDSMAVPLDVAGGDVQATAAAAGRRLRRRSRSSA